ncbi:DNA/RNA HELICASE (DEAD/DEAH BOX FAMILY) [Olavius algarvensis spirochete endosymbiont]|uniref:DEAD/DEAH box helicase family protein n=1 Tax=Olavius algarvensis spirochete endosymbiont TaxID=260710 RepID=UPI000F128D3C|nr:DEAD/DEAH box helicase family protein [Olavius algarvensis spirochete endosymbiont]VDB00461.1 DNA/RNA HELICASE (DEAD/DEAH BOX FAMILY) [Olavius algarvensis spirochete endosymbiont]
MSEEHFLSPTVLLSGGPNRFNLAIERLLLHLGFSDVRVIDGSGDGGGDILGVRGSDLFIFQNKWTTGQSISRDAVDEAETAKAKYGADRAVVATNAAPDAGATKRARRLAGVGVSIEFWTREHLPRLFEAIPTLIPSHFELRPYQLKAVEALQRDLREHGRGLLVLATGLGKTVIGGEVIAQHIQAHPVDDILVVAHMKDLVQQLERALWRHLPKQIRTQLLTGDSKPVSLEGVTCATVESALSAVYDGYRPALIMVDETHHVAEEGQFQKLLDLTSDAGQFGVTATPWRGDRFDISSKFGEPSFKMGIADGMAQGYLAQVDYRLFVDDIDWDVVRQASKEGYTLKELNAKLFLPQRDETVADHLWNVWSATRNPRAILFCRTIEHAERMASVLARYSPVWRATTCLHSKHGKRDRDVLLSQFRLGRVPILTAVDILNEGVDVPDVNVLAFLRVTHSRRIFVQQLGRGLRLREGKEKVAVLDFATDIRRVAAVLNLRRDLESLRGPSEVLKLRNTSEITFTNTDVGSLMDAWIKDAASLETAMDEARLQFPEVAQVVPL